MQGKITDDNSLIGLSSAYPVNQGLAERVPARRYRIRPKTLTGLLNTEERSSICQVEYLTTLVAGYLSVKIHRAAALVRNRIVRKLGIAGLIALSSVGLTNKVKAACVGLGYGPTGSNIKSCDAIETISEGVRNDRKACPYSDSIRVGHTEQFAPTKRHEWPGYNNAGHYIDRGRYYWLDESRYHYIDARQYNLLGAIGHLLNHSGYPVWHDSDFRWWDRYLGGGIGLLSNLTARWVTFYGTFDSVDQTIHLANKPKTLLDNICDHTDQAVLGTFDARHVYRNAGDYADRGWYYCLDEGQYYYLDKRHYNLLGGTSYLLGHPCYPLWHGYYLPWHSRYLRKEKTPANEADQEWVEFYGGFTIFHEPAQPGDELHAFVADADSELIRVGQFTVTAEGWYGYMKVVRDNPSTACKDGALPGEIVTFAAWDESAAGWLHAQILSGLPRWSSHRAQIRVDINAVPEPSSVGLMGLGALGLLALRGTRNNRRAAKTL